MSCDKSERQALQGVGLQGDPVLARLTDEQRSTRERIYARIDHDTITDLAGAEILEVLKQLIQLGTRDAVIIGNIPSDAINAWPGRNGASVVVTRNYRRHFFGRHPEVKRHEAQIIQAVRSPSATFRYDADPTVVNLALPLSDRHDLWVSVQLPYGNETVALVRSARVQRRKETERWERRGRQLWTQK